MRGFTDFSTGNPNYLWKTAASLRSAVVSVWGKAFLGESVFFRVY